MPFSNRAKKWEPHAIKLRRMSNCVSNVLRFDPWKLAPAVGLRVAECNFAGLTDEEKEHLQGAGKSCWSGGVYAHELPDGTRLCILNPLHSLQRNRITLMEEICHCYFKHQPTTLIISEDGLAVRDYKKSQEEEAYGVGAAVLMPWSLLFPKLNGGMTAEQMCSEFDVTLPLLEYRIRICGASALYKSRMLGQLHV